MTIAEGTNTRVRQLRDDARATMESCTTLLEKLTAEQAAIVTEIGWTVAATAAHLAIGTKYGTTQVKQLKEGKAPTVPTFVVDAVNLITSRRNRATPIAESVAKIRAHTAASLDLLGDWTDTALDTRYKKPYFGAITYEQGLRNTFIGHFDEHMGQVRRALKR